MGGGSVCPVRPSAHPAPRPRELSGWEAAELPQFCARPSSWQADRRGERCVAAVMGQLCCFPFSRGEEKISEKHAPEPDDAELVSLSKRLVENAVLKAVQQYLEETQNKARQTDGSPVKAEEAASGTKNESNNDTSK